MTPRFDAWQLALYNRDQTLVTLAAIGAALVWAWCMVGLLPYRYQSMVRIVYLVGGLSLYLFWIVKSLF